MRDRTPKREQPDGPSVVLPLSAALCWTAGLLLAAVNWRLSPAELAHAWPWSAPAAVLDGAAPAIGTWPLAAILAAVGLGMGVASWRRLPDPASRRSLATLCSWPAAPLATGWLAAPAAGPPGWPLAVWLLAATAAAAALLARSGARRPGAAGRIPAHRGRLWVGVHLGGVVLLIGLGLGGGGYSDRPALLVSLVSYPIYALLQLSLLLAVVWPHLHRLAAGRRGPAIATSAVLFALVHWPNPLLMLLCAAGMTVWAREYARGRGLLQLAISMGLLATLVAQGLPDRWTDHMRVGPRYVRQQAVPILARQAGSAAATTTNAQDRLATFLRALYPDITGRTARPDELERWQLAVAPCRRASVAWLFYRSDEYRRRHAEPAGEAALPGDVHWTRLPPPWPERIGAYCRPPANPVPESDRWSAHLERLYREILGREPTPAELASWSETLSPSQEQRLVEVLLERRRALAAAAFDTLACDEMLLHH